jgi:hypothetical protein
MMKLKNVYKRQLPKYLRVCMGIAFLAIPAATVFAQGPPPPPAGPPKPAASPKSPPPMPAPANFHEDFEKGYLVFDDGVGVVHVRQSGSTAETDYAPGIASSKGGDDYARLLVQAALRTGGGINGSQPGSCSPGAVETDNSFSCGGPFTEWGLPFGGFDGSFGTGIPIKGNGSMTSIDIYLDTAFAAGNNTTANGKDFRFDWDSDLLDSKGSFLQDYIFNVATGNASDTCSPGGGFFVVEASTNSQRSGANAHNPAPPNPPQACISSSGWYTFTHVFTKDHNNNLEVDMTITTVEGNHLVASWALHPTCMGTQVSEGLCLSGAPLPFSAVGSNWLGWFPDQEINDLAIDNVIRQDH